MTTFTTEDGLPNNVISGIAPDAEGNMWIATSAGAEANATRADAVCRYDGTSFVNYSSSDGVTIQGPGQIHGDARGTLWIATQNGLLHFDFQSILRVGQPDGLDPGMVTDLASTADGNVWIVVNDTSTSGHPRASSRDTTNGSDWSK